MTEPATMDFGDALRAIKDGKKAARIGWNGKGMYIFLAECEIMHTEADLSDMQDKDTATNKFICLKTANNEFQPGWNASTADVLATDWLTVK